MTHLELVDKLVNQLHAKIQETKMLVTCQRFGICFYLGWSSSILQFRLGLVQTKYAKGRFKYGVQSHGYLLAAVI